MQIEARVLLGVLGPPGRGDVGVGDVGGVGAGEPAGPPREREPVGRAAQRSRDAIASLLEYRCRVNRLFRLPVCPSHALFTGLFLSFDMEFNQGLHV